MVSATRVPNTGVTWNGQWIFRSVSYLVIDRSHQLFISLQVLTSTQHGYGKFLPVFG